MPDAVVHGFVKWARSTLTPLPTTNLQPNSPELGCIGKMIGDATLVALSEGVHCAAEPLEFRNRLLEYLVEYKGFTSVAIESGLVESRLVHEYVRGANFDIEEVLSRGFSWSFGRLPQNRTLIEWLRKVNAQRCPARKVNFYGYDISGSPTNSHAARSINTALLSALDYIAAANQPAGANYRARFEGLLPYVRFDLQTTKETRSYNNMRQGDRDTLTASIADLITLLERKESQFRLATGPSDYEWGYRAAIAARQIDNWLRQIPVGWQLTKEPLSFGDLPDFFSTARDVRDRAQADNVEWIVKQEGHLGRILLFGSRYHLSNAPVKAAALPGPSRENEQEVAGTHLRRRWGRRLVSIGNLIGSGTFGLPGTEHQIKRGPEDTLESIAAKVGPSIFLLDLRSAPSSIAEWLRQEHRLGDGVVQLRLEVSRGFDVLFYIDAVVPAHAKPS